MAMCTYRFEDMAGLAAEDLQDLIEAVTREYAARCRAGERVDAFGAGAITAAEVAITVSAMLASVGVEPFELGLWQAWGQ
jgi:hypothetical protein